MSVWESNQQGQNERYKDCQLTRRDGYDRIKVPNKIQQPCFGECIKIVKMHTPFSAFSRAWLRILFGDNWSLRFWCADFGWRIFYLYFRSKEVYEMYSLWESFARQRYKML